MKAMYYWVVRDLQTGRNILTHTAFADEDELWNALDTSKYEVVHRVDAITDAVLSQQTLYAASFGRITRVRFVPGQFNNRDGRYGSFERAKQELIEWRKENVRHANAKLQAAIDLTQEEVDREYDEGA